MAIKTRAELIEAVTKIAEKLNLEVKRNVNSGLGLWGNRRRIDIVVIHKTSRESLGLQCEYKATQEISGEKSVASIEDIGAWPIPGLLVFEGPGFSANMKGYLYSTGKAVSLDDLEAWLRLFCGEPFNGD